MAKQFAASRRSAAFLGLAGLLTCASPALADVKAGVDAWTRGDWAAAVREWAGPAQAGDPDAQFNLAQAYRLGRGVDADSRQAEALYAKAAAQGHVKAADNYGLLLFQSGRREDALPYIQAASGRGDPRAQYLLGIAHFNGDLVAKDWRQAYALMTLANSVGLPQARAALEQMDQHIPIEDRQASQTLAAALKTEAEAARARDLAAVDLALGKEADEAPTRAPVPARASPPVVAAAPVPAPARPAQPGAPVVVASLPPAQMPQRAPVVTPPKVAAAPARVAGPAAAPASGPWKLQLGAFGVASNAAKLWSKVSVRPELAGKSRIEKSSGKLTVLYAGGFASREAAQSACAALKNGGQDCFVTQ